MALKHCLYLIEHVTADQRLMGSQDIEFRPNKTFRRKKGSLAASRHGFLRAQPRILILASSIPGQGNTAHSRQLEHASSNGRFCTVNLDGAFKFIVAVPKRRAAGINALLGFFAHSLLHFFFQVFNVIPCEDYVNSVDQFRLGLGLLTNDLPFFRQRISASISSNVKQSRRLR